MLQTTTGELPASVRDAVLARVAGLSRDARQVLDAAAMIGSRIPLQLLVSVTGASPAMIDELAACGVLTGEAAHLRFRHEIARIAVQTAIAPHRSVMAHRGILDALRAGGCDDYARLAFHAEGAGDDALVLESAPLAGRRASSLAAHREAAAQFQRALRSAAGADARTAATLDDELANELSLVDRAGIGRRQDGGASPMAGCWRPTAGRRQPAAALPDDVAALPRPGRQPGRRSRAGVARAARPGARAGLGLREPRHRAVNHGEHVQSIGLAGEPRRLPGRWNWLTCSATRSTPRGTPRRARALTGGLLHRALETARAHGLGEQAGRATRTCTACTAAS